MFAAGIYQLESIQDVLPVQVESYQCSNDKIMKTKKGLMQRPTVMCYWNYLWPTLWTKQKNWKQICVSKRASHYLKHTKIEGLVLKWIALGFYIIEWKILAPGTSTTLCMLTELKSYGVRMPPKWYPALKWSPIRPWNDTDPEMIPS